MKRRAGKWIAAVIGISMVLGACAGGKAEPPVRGTVRKTSRRRPGQTEQKRPKARIHRGRFL